jgi:hypothetical protein
VNAPRIANHRQLFKSNPTFCVVCDFTLQTGEWCVHNRLFNANIEDKLMRYLNDFILIQNNVGYLTALKIFVGETLLRPIIYIILCYP